MFFYMTTKVYQEPFCVFAHASEWATLGTKALIVTGRNSAKKTGALQDVLDGLTSQGRSYVLYDKIEENPSIETIMDARSFGLENHADFVIGIGGGSPLDASKAIALMMYHKEDDESYLYHAGDSTALPVVAVPTTCGTGSEATPYAILTRHALMTKGSISHKIFPTYALVDGKYLAFAPKQVICNTAIDAFAHFVESYINTNATAYSRMCVKEGLSIWAGCKSVLDGTREAGDADYQNLMTASTMAGMAISMTTTSLPHGLSYPITYRLGMPHGMAVGYFQAGYLSEAPAEDRQFILDLAGFATLDELQEFYHNVCKPEKISDELLALTADTLASNQAKLKNCPYYVNQEIIKRIVNY